MIPPIPRAFRAPGPSPRRRCSPVASVWARASGFLRSSPLTGSPRGDYLKRDLDDLRRVLKVVFCWVLRRFLAAFRRALLFCISSSGVRGPEDCKDPPPESPRPYGRGLSAGLTP